jgi:hypothetical protein
MGWPGDLNEEIFYAALAAVVADKNASRWIY